MNTTDDVVDLYKSRYQIHSELHSAMREIAEVYDGDSEVPLPELSQDEKPAVPNLVRQGIDQEAMRVASPTPTVMVPTVGGTQTAIDRANRRRRAHLGALEANDVDLMMRFRARHLLGFAMSPCVLLPDWDVNGTGLKGARWDVIDPRMAYPAPNRRPGEVTSDDFVYAVKRTVGWLRRAGYTDAHDQFHGDIRGHEHPDDVQISVLTHVDADHITQVALRDEIPMMRAPERAVTLQKVVNRAQVPLATCPVSINLDRTQSQFEGMLGMYQARAKLMALAIIATQRNVFSDWWLEEREGATEAAEIVSQPDPYNGDVGVVRGGKLVPDRPDSQFNTTQIIHEVEQGERMTGSIPAEFGGTSSTNIRTGRRGAQVMSASVDFYIEEAQMLLARSLQTELETSAMIEHAWFAGDKKAFYVNWKGDKGYVDYDPGVLWNPEQNDVRVTHAMAGVDVDSLIIGAGQRVGMDTLSRDTFMTIDPMVEDPEGERSKITVERLTAAFLAKMETDANDPESMMTALDLASLTRKIQSGTDIFEAADEVQTEVQERLAAEQQMPADPGTPEAMPGPMGEGAVPSVRAPGQSLPGLEELGQVALASRAPQMTIPAEGPI
jgi:hypothetical protein